MVYGGRLAPGGLVQDTWAWDGTTWTRVDTGTAALPAYATMAWDDTRRQMILVDNAGDSRRDVDLEWIALGAADQAATCRPGTFLVGMAVDPVTHSAARCQLLLAGPRRDLHPVLGRRRMAHLTTHTVPGFTVSLVRDPGEHRLLLFGDSVDHSRKVWSWNGQDWSLLHRRDCPGFPGRRGGRPDTHAAVVIVGSVAEPVQGNPQPVQVWSLTGRRGCSWLRDRALVPRASTEDGSQDLSTGGARASCGRTLASTTEEDASMLDGATAHTTLPAMDMERATEFYTREGRRHSARDGREGGSFFALGDSMFSIYPTPNPNRGGHTQMGLRVPDARAAVDELRSRGVVFEEYDFPGLKTVDGIADIGGGGSRPGSRTPRTTSSAWSHLNL